MEIEVDLVSALLESLCHRQDILESIEAAFGVDPDAETDGVHAAICEDCVGWTGEVVFGGVFVNGAAVFEHF